MQHKLVSHEELKIMQEDLEINHTKLRDEVAKIAFESIIETTKIDPEFVARISFDFAEAFMRERYERDSILRQGLKANIPDHLGQLNL